MRKKVFLTALSHTLPVLTGYLFLGFAYGLLMRNAGFSVLTAVLMSAVVYAGSMQYAAVSLLCAPFDPLGTVLLTLMINARHLFYGVAMLRPYQNTKHLWPYLAFSLTDETFSVNVSLQDGTIPPQEQTALFGWVSVLNHTYWVLATALGALFGTVMQWNIEGISFVMTALFVTIFIGQWNATQEHRPAMLGVGTSVVCLLLFGAQRFILPAMALLIGALALLRPVLGAKEEAA